MGDIEEALRNAREALDVEVCCVGPDVSLAEPGEATVEWIQKLESELQQPKSPPSAEKDTNGKTEEASV